MGSSQSRFRVSLALVVLAISYRLYRARLNTRVLCFQGRKPEVSSVIGKVSKLTVFPVKVSSV